MPLLLPYQTLVLESPLTPTQALERLKAAVEPRQWAMRSRHRERPFEGTVAGTGFRMQRTIEYRNSFVPQLHGRIEPTPGGRARLVVSFRIHPAVVVFVATWFSFLGCFGVAAIDQPTVGAGGPSPRLLLGGMLGFGVLLLFAGFMPEAHKAARLLVEIFEAS